jgi:hypothetical protein
MFLTTINSCLVWLQYGLSPPLSRAIVIVNDIGILIEVLRRCLDTRIHAGGASRDERLSLILHPI